MVAQNPSKALVASRKRVPLTLPPRPVFVWEGVFESFAKSWTHKHFWRVREYFCNDREDALQECAWLFWRCVRHYESYVDEQKWMMALYKRTLWTHWHTLASGSTCHRELPAALADQPEALVFNAGPLQSALTSCSAELKQFLSVMADAPAEFLQLLFRDDSDLSKLNLRARRLLGISNPAVDIVSELRQVLSE